MAPRAVSAGRLLTPPAVLVPIAATPLVSVWIWSLHTGPGATGALLGLLVLTGGFATISAVGGLTYGLRTSVITAILTWLVAYIVRET